MTKLARGQRRLTARAAFAALVATLALAPAPTALGDDWARDRAAAAAAVQELDPAIRTAIAARASTATDPTASEVVPTVPSAGDGFAWGAAALGLGVGIAAACVLLGCVTLVRNDGRLRSA
jgi:hypothetical protein